MRVKIGITMLQDLQLHVDVNIREGTAPVGNGSASSGRTSVIFILHKGKRKLLHDELFP